MAQKGWDATGLIEPLWLALKPPTPDELARRAGVHVKTIYSVNSGDKPLGYQAGKKLAKAGNVTLAELGAPEEVADDRASQKIRDRLAKLEDEAVRVEDLDQVLRVVELLVAGKRAEAQRAFSDVGLAAK